jgi:hypothetical protein
MPITLLREANRPSEISVWESVPSPRQFDGAPMACGLSPSADIQSPWRSQKLANIGIAAGVILFMVRRPSDHRGTSKLLVRVTRHLDSSTLWSRNFDP